MPQLVLASASPRRKDLLAQIGILAIVLPVELDETPLINEKPIDYVARLAAEKSDLCRKQFNPVLPILAADTTVEIDGCILGKPQDEAEGLEIC